VNPRWVVGGLAALVFIAAEFGVTVSSGPNTTTQAAVLARPAVIPVAASFVSARQGWELGRSGCVSCAKLRMTSDGGRTWRSLPAPPTRLSLNTPSPSAVADLVFADRSDGWLFGPGLYATHDAGRTWALQHLPPVVTVQVGAGAVYAMTKAGLWQSPVAGGHWTRLRTPSFGRNGAALAVTGRRLMLLQIGYEGPSIGSPGVLWFSAKGGGRWRRRPVACRHQGGAALVASAGGRSWLIDCYSNDQSQQEQRTSHLVYASSDDGKTWQSLGRPTQEGQPSALAGTGGRAFLAVESGGDDRLVGRLGGPGWRVAIDFAGFGFTGWADLRFVSSRTGFVVAPSRYLGPGGRDHVYRTDDGGRTWREIA
jgi:photosystem II stability/assembly factor-like uncharacterized protein